MLVRKAVIIALAAALSLTLILGIIVANREKSDGDYNSSPDINNGQNFGGNSNDNVSDPLPPPSDEDSSYGESVTAQSLSANLYYMKEMDNADRISEEDIKFFDGCARLIWKFSDEEFFRVCPISSYQLREIQKAIDDGKNGTFPPDRYSSKLEGFWISLGDGKIISPFLISSDGNTGYNKLFSYDAEIEPSEHLTNYICNIIERHSLLHILSNKTFSTIDMCNFNNDDK